MAGTRTPKKIAAPALPDPTVLDGVSNSAEETIALDRPWFASVQITGAAALLFHRYQSESVEAKAKAAKGSAAKKTDDTESYLWRDDEQRICLPGSYLAGSICGPNGAAKYRQDPRSPRKSALDLFKAGVVVLTDLAPIVTNAGMEATEADYYDRRRVVVQRAAVSRERPAFWAGWSATFELSVLLGQYISPSLLHEVITDAGRLVGVGDFRPSFGRYQVTAWAVSAH